MNGKNNETETPPVDMKTRAITWLLMQGLGVVVLVVLSWTQHSSIQEKDKQILHLSQDAQSSNREMIVLLTELKTLLNDIKYQNRVEEIRKK